MTDQRPADREPVHTASAHPLRVLVVDDSSTTRRLVRLVLERRGHAVFEADTADGAVNATQRDQPDVIVLDLNLASTRSGAAIAPILKSLGRAPQVLVYSAYLHGEVWPGVDDTLSKEEPLDALVARVESLGEGRSAVGS